jgi:uncharacterized membrane protein YesL
MADKKTNQEKKGRVQLKLLSKLTLAPEKRNEPSKGAYPAGRFKLCTDIIRSNLSNLSIINILTLIFALPLLAALIYFSMIGAEGFSYLLNNTDTPYLLSDFGIGLSHGSSLADVKAGMLMSYRVLFLAIAVCLPILGAGFAGLFYIVTKMVWGEGFICKKDKYGNDVPRIVLEYFRGVKLYWKQPVLIMAVFGVVVAGASNLIINFIEGLWLQNLNAGDYIGLTAALIVGLASVLILFNLLPMTVAYDLPLLAKLKNATLITIVFFVPTLLIMMIACLPFVLLAGGPMLQMLAALVFCMIGLSYFSLISANYLGYNSEKILVPLYEATMQAERKKSSKKGKKSKK